MPTGKFNTTAYRYPNEEIILGVTILLAIGVVVLTATATVCMSVVFIGLFVFYAHSSGTSHHRELIAGAQRVTRSSTPGLAQIVEESTGRLQVEPVDVFIVHNNTLNAYTFGLSSPKAVVVYDGLLRAMDHDEVQFVVGHELGHVDLGHTWLNSLAGGMAGIPASISAALILTLALRWWNRACEFSADRAGLLACNNPQKAISALLKLELGPQARQLSPQAVQQAMTKIAAEDDSWLEGMGEAFATHPMIERRVRELMKFMRSAEYQNLQAKMNQNLAN